MSLAIGLQRWPFSGDKSYLEVILTLQTALESKLTAELKPLHLEVINESHMHNVPPDSETHFKVVVVSEAFAGKRLVQRHQMVYGIVAEELRGGVHALALHTHLPSEWQGRAPESPACLGGGRG
ncbi:MAG: BolA/IbaG family iron-sulfur metabolism protein [Anaerolineaceae bacterium]|nr:BolA/IbaG family iron-sulfur metabolism protein [Anaerolineaceae bacterium]